MRALLSVIGICSVDLASATCEQDLDCELLGQCIDGTCRCSPGFTGATCGQLDLQPVPSESHGRVWPVNKLGADDPYNQTMSWSFSPVFDPDTGRYNAVLEVGCGPVWDDGFFLAAVSSDHPDRGFSFDQRLSPDFANSPHLVRADDGTYVLYFQKASGHPEDAQPACTGNASIPAADSDAMKSVMRRCGPGESDNCISSGLFVATTDSWPRGPWTVRRVSVEGPGWSPYNATLSTIGTSNPSPALLRDGRVLLAFRSHEGYWPSITPTHGENGEHIGFAMAQSVYGPFQVVANLSWEYGNDEDPFVWQQPDGTMHLVYHNGRGASSVNHGLHAFSQDGHRWFKPSDHLSAACLEFPAHKCSAMYTSSVTYTDASSAFLGGRERPALLFDGNGRPTHLYNGVIPAGGNRKPWFAMAQSIGSNLLRGDVIV